MIPNPRSVRDTALIVWRKLISLAGYFVLASSWRQPYFGRRILGTNFRERGEGSIWKSVVKEPASALWHFSSHSAAFGIGRLFSSMPSKSSRVFPTPPWFPGRLFFIQPCALIFLSRLTKSSFVNVFTWQVARSQGGTQM